MLLESTYSVQDSAGIVFALRGPLDVPAGRCLARRIVELAEQGSRDFVIDLSTAEAVDPSAMESLVPICVDLESSRVRVSVVLASALAIFAADGRDAFFDVAVTREAAVARLSRQPARSLTGARPSDA